MTRTFLPARATPRGLSRKHGGCGELKCECRVAGVHGNGAADGGGGIVTAGKARPVHLGRTGSLHWQSAAHIKVQSACLDRDYGSDGVGGAGGEQSVPLRGQCQHRRQRVCMH